MLNESYYTNITNNQSNPQSAAHTNLVTSIRTPDCTAILSYDYSLKCDFLNSARLKNKTNFDPEINCDSIVAMFDYLGFLYCKLNVRTPGQEHAGAVLLFLILIYYFMILGVTADTFFCPALTVLAKFLRLNDTLAGVTLLAFGNGSPDLFTSFSTKDSESPTLFYQLLGASLFVTAFISSVIMVINPFKIDGAEFTRDCSFLMFAVGYLDLILTDGYVNIYESVGIFLIYVIYIAVIIIDQVLIKMEQKEHNKYMKFVRAELMAVKEPNQILSFTPSSSVVLIERNATISRKNKWKFWNSYPVRQLLSSINPISVDSWKHLSKISKFIAIIKSPLLLILFILLPVVDSDKEMNGWSKLLNCIQITILPVVFMYQTMPSLSLFGIPIYVFVLICCLPITFILLLFTKTSKAPKFHIVYAVIAIAGSIWIIQVFADEVVNILTSVGIVIRMTQSFLAVTFLALGNSIGDLITNITMARQGHQKMGLSACFGGPLFNLLIGMGFVCISKSVESKDNRLPLSEGSIGDNCVIFLLIFLCFLLLGLSFVNFHGSRRIGSFGALIYTLFIIYVLLSLSDTIHEYGTDHREDDLVDGI